MWSFSIAALRTSGGILQWLVYLVRLAGFSFALLAAWMLWKRRPIRWMSASAGSNTSRTLAGSVLTAAKVVTDALILVTVFFLGYYIREGRELDRTRHYERVKVIKKYDNYTYDLLFTKLGQFGQVNTVHICHSVNPDWDEGMTMDVTWEELGTCMELGDGEYQIDRMQGRFVDFRLQEK